VKNLMIEIRIDFNRSPSLSDSITIVPEKGIYGIADKITKYLSENWLTDSDYRISISIPGSVCTHVLSVRLNVLDSETIDIFLHNSLYLISESMQVFIESEDDESDDVWDESMQEENTEPKGSRKENDEEDEDVRVDV